MSSRCPRTLNEADTGADKKGRSGLTFFKCRNLENRDPAACSVRVGVVRTLWVRRLFSRRPPTARLDELLAVDGARATRFLS